jgi:hypothetical protein
MYMTLSRIQTVDPLFIPGQQALRAIQILPRFYQMIWFIAFQHDTHRKQFFRLLELIKALVYVNYLIEPRAHDRAERQSAGLGSRFKSSRRRRPCANAHVEKLWSQLGDPELKSSEIWFAQIQDMAGMYSPSFLSFPRFFELLANYSSNFFRSRGHTFNGVLELSIANEKEGHSVGWDKVMALFSDMTI